MLKQTVAATLTLAMAASSAHAATGFGSSGFSAGDTAKKVRHLKNAPLLAAALDFLSLRLSITAAAPAPTPVAERAREPNITHYECETVKEEEQEKLAEARRTKRSGPEPVYLAF